METNLQANFGVNSRSDVVRDCLAIMVVSSFALTFAMLLAIGMACNKETTQYQLVPCQIWTTVDNPVAEYCQVVLYKQELLTFWKIGFVIETCPCNQCPAAKNVTKTQCWYNEHTSNSRRFRDSAPKLGGCSSQVDRNLHITLAVFFGLMVVSFLGFCLQYYWSQKSTITSPAPSSSQSILIPAHTEIIESEVDEEVGVPLHIISALRTTGPRSFKYSRLSDDDNNEVKVAL